MAKSNGGAWQGRDSDVAREVDQVSRETLNAYREAPRLVEEHHKS